MTKIMKQMYGRMSTERAPSSLHFMGKNANILPASGDVSMSSGTKPTNSVDNKENGWAKI